MKFGENLPIRIRVSSFFGFAVLEVTDFGPQVDVHEEFDIFHRHRNDLDSIEIESLRLELRLCMTIIHEHGGYLEVQTSEDGGNTLKMFLPV